jgi:hypothetical protein
MKKTLLYLIIALVLIIGASSCKKAPTGNSSGIPWKSSWLIPAIKGSLSLANLKELRDNEYTHEIPALSLGFPTGVQIPIIPPITINHIGPFAQQISPWLHKANVDSFDLDISLQNLFPIPIGAGTQVVLRNDRDSLNPANIIYTYTIPKDVAPNETFTINLKVINKSFEDTIFMYLDQFTSIGGTNVTFTPTPTLLTLKLKVLIMKSIEIYTNKSFESNEIIGLDLSSNSNSSSNSNFSDTSATGNVTIYLDNLMPVNVGMQIYFLASDTITVVDSLLSTPLTITGATTDIGGEPLNSTKSKSSIEVSVKRIENMKACKNIKFKFLFNTLGYPSTYVVANKNAKLLIQIVGDLNLDVKF